ncbi:sulfatase-like hydrolase/transferase [Roseibacillus persicicus]|uniref:sulfatase-like hydrolase/transferase n=1 Tax=Roseibacillus persicicus TaxID=454148 RepID=UPI00398AE2B9
MRIFFLLFGLVSALPSAPNVIFILCDDLGYGDVYNLHQHTRDNGAGGGIAGDGLINGSEEAFIYTPHLDRMAAEGARLIQHYTSAPVCAPARGSLLQGRDQGHANIRNNSFDKVIEDNHTLGSVMKEAGYYTACIGKWGVGGGTAPYAGHPNRRGFDYFYGYMKHGQGHEHYPGNGGTVLDQEEPVTSGLDHAYTTDLWTARSKKLIQEHHANDPETPFFLYLAYDAPHAKLQVPTQAYPAGMGASGGLSWPLNTNSGTNDSWIHPDYSSLSDSPARHATMVRRLDDCVGDLLQTLRDLGIDDETLVVFSSDNGTHNEAGGGGTVKHDPQNFDSYGILEGIKRDQWEGGIRMPTFAWWPGQIGDNDATTPAMDSTRPSAFWDWMPTFAEAAGLTPPAWSNGVSLLPELTGSGSQQDKGYLYFEYYNNGSTPNYADFPVHRQTRRNQMQAIFLDDSDGKRYKGIRYNVGDHEGDDFLIYDVSTDPSESTDLAASKIALQQRMKDEVLRVRVDGDYNRSYLTSEFAPPVTLPNIVNGLNYRAYEGSWPWVPETDYLTAVSRGESSGLDLSKRPRDAQFALEFTGYFLVPLEGEYTFEMTADAAVGTDASGAMLWIHDANVIADDFNRDGSARTGSMRLQAGLHPIRVAYKHETGARSLSLQYSGPGVPLQEIPAESFFIEGDAGPEPVARPDQAVTTESASVLIPVLLNDTDDGAPAELSISEIGEASLGTASISGNRILYDPVPGKFGVDQFTYTITDGENQVQSLVTVTIEGKGSVLSSDFNGHGSVDGAGQFTGIIWQTDGVSTPSSTLTLSVDAEVQTDGASANVNRIAVDRNIDKQGPWSVDIGFTASQNLTLSDLTFDYEFISGAGNLQGNAHPGSGIVTVSLLDGSASTTLTTVTLPALGAETAANNSGTGIVADFPDYNLTTGSSYVLRFHVTSSVTLGNNFSFDNLSLNKSVATPSVFNFSASPQAIAGTGDVSLNWSTSSAGQLVLSDGSNELVSYRSGVNGQEILDSGSYTLTGVDRDTTFILRVASGEDGSGGCAVVLAKVVVGPELSPLSVEVCGIDSETGEPFIQVTGLESGEEYQLFRSSDLVTFEPAGSPMSADEAGSLVFSDSLPLDVSVHPRLFYQVRRRD